MGWADNLYQNEPELAPYNEKGGHIISAILDSLGWGPARRGEWSGGSSEVNAPAWGRKPGESAIAQTGMSVPWPTTGAMTATGTIPTALAAAKSRAALAQSNVPAYAAIGKSLQDAPGIAENAWNLGKEGAQWLGEKLGSFVPQMEPAMQGAAAVPSAQGYRSLLHETLGKHGIVIPYIPESSATPLLMKTPYEKNVSPLAQYLPGNVRGEGALGLYKPLWHPFSGAATGESPTEGSVILSTLKGQNTTIPHEFSHDLQDALTGIYSGGGRPLKQEVNTNAKYGWPIREQFPEWKPLQATDNLDALLNNRKPGMQYETEAADLWDKFGNARSANGNPSSKQRMRDMWDYGNDDRRMANELIAEMANPQGLANRLNKPLSSGEEFKTTVSNRYPALNRFWDYLPETIPEKAYDIPVWDQRWLANMGQGTTQGANRVPQEYIDSLFGQGR